VGIGEEGEVGLLVVAQGEAGLEDDRPQKGLGGVVVPRGLLERGKGEADGELRLPHALEELDHVHEEGHVEALLVGLHVHVRLHGPAPQVRRLLQHVLEVPALLYCVCRVRACAVVRVRWCVS
jgi:hypothetical protein